MAVHLDYDTDQRIIYVTTAPTGGTFVLNAQVDIYSDMKEDWRTNAALNKLKFPLSEPVGGNTIIPGSKYLAPYYFLKFGWTMRPYEADHTLYITDGYLLLDGGGDPWRKTLGGYTVNIRDVVPSDATVQQIISGSGVTEQDKLDIADRVWDETLTGADHNTPTSAGRRLRDLSTSVIITGTAVSSTNNTIVLDNDASSMDGAYDPAIIAITNGTGAGQTRLIFQYNGSSKTAIVDRNWKVNPDATSEYTIIADAGREHVNEGLCQGGGTNTITLNALASDADDAYKGQVVFIRSGTGEDQARRILAYVGSTKVATVSAPWSVTPDNTSAYVMLPISILHPDGIANAVWNAFMADHQGVGTTGERLDNVPTDTENADAVWNKELP